MQATPIAVNFVKAELPPANTATALPFLLDNSNDTIFLKFKVPDILQVTSLNSITVSVMVFDDDDGGGESGSVEFALPGLNIPLTSFAGNIRTYTAGSPLILSASVCSCELSDVYASMLDGNFRIKVLRTSGDFYVEGATVDIDANMPEPASASTTAGALLLLAALMHPSLRRKYLRR